MPIKYASFVAPEMGPVHRTNTRFPQSGRGLQMLYTESLLINLRIPPELFRRWLNLVIHGSF